MTDYAHELQFGVFIPPVAEQADAVVELAQLAEVSGLDLVTFQDHPYQPRFLDTWTLLSVIAAQTSTVRLAPNVANLPLRPPAVLARSVASLDILSGGRVELGLGAGAFWDGIEANGGRRLTPGQSVDALGEAIEVIRAIWRGGRVHVDGEHYTVRGRQARAAAGARRRDLARRLQAADARADRSRRRTGGCRAWATPTLEDLPAMNAAIDAAAIDAGRSPADVRRMLNVNPGVEPSSWPSSPVEQGFSTFILSVSTADEVRRFAEETAPAVRELVDAGRRGRAGARSGWSWRPGPRSPSPSCRRPTTGRA